MREERDRKMEEDVDVIAKIKWSASDRQKVKVDCNRELEKQRAFGYLMLGVAGLYVLYFFVGLFGEAFVPYDGFHRFALCTQEINLVCVGGAGFCIIFFSYSIEVRSAKRSATITGLALGVCCIINIGLLVWMGLTQLDPFALASIICSFVCVLGGILLTFSFYKAMTTPDKFLMLVPILFVLFSLGYS